MKLIYNTGIRIYYLLILFASVFNTKAKKWIIGRKHILKQIQVAGFSFSKNIWIHVSSLGEFEQARPVIEKIKTKYPDYKIILTFFSPSGYELRKNYDKADYVFYLPLDTRRNASKFIEIIKPQIVFFVKYDYWYNYLNQAFNKKIPVCLFSAIFRKNQLFFKWYGNFYRKILGFFTYIFVQNEESVKLLSKINITNTAVTGDTRFDRVYEIAQNAKEIEIVKEFAGVKKVFIAGSSWPPDEDIFLKFFNNKFKDTKLIIAPHDIGKSHINQICKLIEGKWIKYSEVGEKDLSEYNVLIIDNIGLLSSLYRYGDIAYIGGAFGAGLHNTQEAITWGLPVIFGPKYKKFMEAVDLINIGAGFTISNYNEFDIITSKLLSDNNLLKKSGQIAKNYVLSQIGATEKILNQIKIKS